MLRPSILIQCQSTGLSTELGRSRVRLLTLTLIRTKARYTKLLTFILFISNTRTEEATSVPGRSGID